MFRLMTVAGSASFSSQRKLEMAWMPRGEFFNGGVYRCLLCLRSSGSCDRIPPGYIHRVVALKNDTNW
jgi:hypothetical protein